MLMSGHAHLRGLSCTSNVPPQCSSGHDRILTEPVFVSAWTRFSVASQWPSFSGSGIIFTWWWLTHMSSKMRDTQRRKQNTQTQTQICNSRWQMDHVPFSLLPSQDTTLIYVNWMIHLYSKENYSEFKFSHFWVPHSWNHFTDSFRLQ